VDRSPPRILLVTNRPSVHAFFSEQLRVANAPLALVAIPLSKCSLDDYRDDLEQAAAAIIDIGADPDQGVLVCAALRARRSDLRILAIVCCATPTLAAHVQELVALRIDDVLDAQATPAEILTALRRDGLAGSLVHLRLHQHYQQLASGMRLLSNLGDNEQRLLQLVAQGKSNQELGVALRVSPRTVRARLERLRPLLGVASREELAAWAGAHGLYRPPAPSTFGSPSA
jgi:DNA-binding NarL/FixJ family response regulator